MSKQYRFEPDGTVLRTEAAPNGKGGSITITPPGRPDYDQEHANAIAAGAIPPAAPKTKGKKK